MDTKELSIKATNEIINSDKSVRKPDLTEKNYVALNKLVSQGLGYIGHVQLLELCNAFGIAYIITPLQVKLPLKAVLESSVKMQQWGDSVSKILKAFHKVEVLKDNIQDYQALRKSYGEKYALMEEKKLGILRDSKAMFKLAEENNPEAYALVELDIKEGKLELAKSILEFNETKGKLIAQIRGRSL